MDFIKKHYEKVLLGLVLVGLVVAAAFLPVMIGAERQALEEKRLSIIRRSAKPLEAPDVARTDLVLARLNTPFALDFSSTNKLFNPVRWIKDPRVPGRLRKVITGSELEGLELTNTAPLYLRITLEDVRTDSSGVRYGIGVQHEAAALVSLRGKRPAFYLSRGETQHGFKLSAVNGPPENPELTLDASELGEPVTISKDKPFTRVEGYTADLYYAPDKKPFTNKRSAGTAAETSISVGGVLYKIVAIVKDEVVVSAPSEKKYQIKYRTAAEPH